MKLNEAIAYLKAFQKKYNCHTLGDVKKAFDDML